MGVLVDEKYAAILRKSRKSLKAELQRAANHISRPNNPNSQKQVPMLAILKAAVK